MCIVTLSYDGNNVLAQQQLQLYEEDCLPIPSDRNLLPLHPIADYPD